MRSAIPGRQRWEVAVIRHRPELAAELQAILAQTPAVTEVVASAASGRVLVRYTADTTLDVEGLLAAALNAAMERGAIGRVTSPGSNPLRRILQISLPPRERLIAPPIYSLAGAGTSILQGSSVLATIDTAQSRGPRFLEGLGLRKSGSRLAFMTGLSVVVTGVDLVVQYHRRRAWRSVALNTRHCLRTRLVTRLEAQDLAYFDRQGIGRVVHLVTRDTVRIGEFVEQAGDGLIERAMIVAVGTAILASSWRLALITALPLPLFLLTGRFFRTMVAQSYPRSAEMSARYDEALQNSFSGITEIKSFTAETREVGRLEEADAKLERASLAAARASSLQSYFLRGIFSTGFCLIAGIGGELLASGKMAQARYNRTMYWAPRVVSALTSVEETLHLHHSATQSARELLQVFDSAPAIRDGPARLPTPERRGQIVFENVSFGYLPGARVLENVSFTLEPGQTLGIVGSTGSGKSTILRLLLRLYDADEGRILLDGHDLRELHLDELREAIAFVSQDVYLFRGTVRRNLLYGRPDAADEELIEVMREASAGELLQSLTGGLDAEVGERGQRLSAGERQRLAIARALLKSAPVLALDEATSHLDYETEAAVKRSIRRAAQGRSVILAAHRLSTIRDADQIIVFENGRIRERGTHRQLVARRGLYASLWRLQSGRL